MTENEVMTLARDFVNAENQGRWMYEIGRPNRDLLRKNEWNVLVRWIHPDGGLFDGPGIVIVDEVKRQARFF